MAIQNINELYDKLSANENFSEFNFGSADDFKLYLEELPEQKKEKFYNAWLEDEDISKDQFENLVKKKETGRTGILSSALGSIDFGSPSVSKSEPQAVVTENVSGQMPIAPAATDVVGSQDMEMGIEDSSVSGVTGGPLASGPGPVKPTPIKKEEPLIKPASQLQGRTFDIGQADEQFAGQKKQIEEKGKEVAKEIAKKAAMLPAAREVIKPVQEQASLIKMLEDQNDFKRNEFVFETPSPQTEMGATGNVYRPMIKTAARPTDEQIGEILYNKERVKLSNPMDIGRWTGPTQHFDEETFEAYLKNKGLSPRNAKIVIQNYINKYLDSKVEDVDFKLSKVEGKTTAEKINKIREQENEYGLDLLTRQYGISVGDKARELQTYMANRKRPGEAGYEQWNKQLGVLQKEMSGLVGGGQRLYNPEDGKLYDRASAPKRALVFKAYLDDAIKVYKNTDVDKLKEIRSNLMDKVKFLEEDYDRKLGPQWRGKGWLKSLSGTMTDDQEEALKNSFATLDKYKAQLSAINSRLLTNTDIEPITTDKTGQFAKQLKAALPGGDFQTQYRTLKDNYGAYVDAVDGVIQLKPEEIEKRELTVGEEAIGAIGSSIPIMVEIIASRSIAPAVEAIRASRYLRPITRGALKLTGNRKFANFVSDMVASAAHGYITYAPTSETGATGVGETLFSEGIYDKVGLNKLGAQWNPVFRYLSKVAFGTLGETAEEFVGEYTNALSETGFDFAQSAEETFGKNVSDFSKKLAVYAASSAVMSSAFNTPELFIKATRFDDVRKLAEEKLQNPNISQDEKETIESSLKMMDSTKQNLDQKEAEEPVNTIDIEASPTEVAAMETFEGAPETKPAAEVIPGEEGVGPVEGAAPKPSVETKGIEQLISPEIKSESIDNADENIEFEPNGYYELLDENGYPSVAYTDSETGRTEFETSEKPQISASKNIGGAITGLFSMLRNNKVNPRQKIAIYEITEKPSVEIPSDARVADFPFLSEVRYDNKVSGKKTKEINLTEKDIDFLNDFYDSFEMDSDQYDNLLKKYNAEDNNELDNIFKDKIFNLIKSEEGKYYRAVIVNKTKTEAVGPQAKTNLQEISTEVAQGGVTDVSLQKIENYGKEIESGNVDFERFSPAEQRGLIEGGPIHVEATIITGKSDRGTDTQDESNDRQEEIVEEYAKKKGIWTENAHAKLNQQHGKPINSGQESIVWLDRKRGVVIKSSNTRNYTTLREALDSITLSNAYFPAAKITVIGFGTDAEGNFEIITEQPYVQGTEATEQEIKDYFNNLGFTENERLYVGKDAFGNEEVIFKDAAPKNVIKTPEGNIIPIDLIAKINKPELNANGTRTVPSTVAEEVAPTEVTPTEVTPTEAATTEVAPVEVAPVEVTPTEVTPMEAAPEAEVTATETAPEATTPPTETTPTEGTAEGYGSQNTIVTKEDYDQAIKNLRNPNIPSGFDFSKLGDLIKAGMYHIEAGSRSFANFSKKMIEQFGQTVKKYLPVVFRRSNTQLQQQAAAPGRTKAPKKAPRPTFDEVRKNIRKDRDDFVKANKTQSPSIIGQYLLSKGYTLGQIKTHLPEYNSYWQKKARELFMDYVKVHQNKIEQRRKEIADFMDKNPTLEYEDIYEQLKDKYSDFELFKAFYEDGASPSLLDETFGTEYRQTIQNLIDSKGYNPDFLRDMDEDIRTRKVEKNLGEAKSIYADLQDFASAEELLDAAAEVLGISGVEEAMKTATDKVRAENKKKADILKAYGKAMKGGFKSEDSELIKNISDILSFSGRMLRMGRGLFMTEKGLADLIIRNLSNITYKKDSNFAKTKKAFRVPEKTQQKIRELVKKYFETKAKLDEAIAQVEDGANAFTDEAFDEFNKARAEHQKASTELKGMVNRLYGSRAPLISRWFTSMTSMALLSFRTIFVGLIGNMEMMLASMPRKTWVGKLLGWTRILANGIVGAQVSFKKGQGLAYEATKRGTGVGIDPSIYRKLAFQQGIQQIKDILRKGLTEQTSSERDFLQGYAEIDGVKDFQLGFKMISKMIKNIAGKEKMTDEEFGAAFDKMLIALEEKDASGNPKLAGMHSKGYYAAAALLRGFFGSIPTITGRAIALSGDRVFYQYGYYEFLATYANSKGITDPAEVKRFIALNSVGDSEAARAAERAANKRIFAQNNAIVRFFGTTKAKLDQLEQNIYGAKIKKKVQGKGIQAAVTGLGAYPIVAAKIALNAFSPFVTIPSNVVSKYLRIGVPVFPLVMAVRTQMQLNSRMNEYQKNYSLKDNAEMSETTKKKMEADRVALFEQQRLAAQYWTEFFQGAQLAGLSYLLVSTGSVGAPYGDDDESKKRARAAGIAQQDAGKLNLSHLFDVVTGKETRGRVAKKGDITIDYRNLGMAGFSISTWASAGAYLKTQQLKNKKLMGADEDVIGMVNAHLITESLKNGVTQLGFIQNISNFISGIKSNKGTEALTSSLLTTVLTVPTLSYGVFSPFERIEGIGSDPLRGYHPDLERSDVFMGEVGARVWTKLTARSPLFGFGLRKEDGTFAAPLKTLGFTPSEFYRPQIGPHGERLYKKSTFWDTRSGSTVDKFLAFAQASLDPLNMSDYESFVSQVKPFDMKQEYKKGDFIEWNNNIWVVTKDKIKGLSPKDAQLGEDKDYILLDTKKNFLDPDRWRRDKEGTRKTQLLFDFVNEYEKATGDRKEYGLFSKLYTDPVKFKDEDGEFAVYIPMEEQRKLSILRGEAMARSWNSDEVENLLNIIQKTAEDENLSDADWKKSTKELFLDYMKGAMDEDQNRSGGLIDIVNEAIKGVEESPEYAAIVRDGIVRSVKEGLLTEAEFDRLAKHTVAGNFIASMDKSKLKFRK
jgi:hypothetical protein